MEVPVADLNGMLSAKPISLKGSAMLNQKVLLTVPDLQIRYGENYLKASGVLDDHSDFALDINAPNFMWIMVRFKRAVKVEWRFRSNYDT